ncbi:efflux RND transporter periplasmic adaptor subunit [Ignavibacterium sp.]|jgi:HlyD family secretion protein|uniref:HlyD family secretion protein n=1 Tax=Ignavibacterium sp. TaxID=2651167 RepID=UPI0025C221F5|nr:efflux RND transporter periplasmic adaptor subunit [Ignavibacterium sp.]
MKTIKITTFFILLLLIAGCGNTDNNTFIEGTGTIESTNVIVSSRNAGEINSILFAEGERVNASDTILIIDHEALEYQLEQALAGEQIAQAQLDLMLKGARSEDIKQAEEMMKQSEVNFNSAKNDFERYKQLWESKSISKKQFEDMTARYDVTLAQYNSAKENYQKVKKIFRPEEIEQAKGNVKKAKASVDLLKKSIHDSYVTSPLSGFIVKKFVEVGETVTPMSSLFKVSNLSTVDLVIYVSEVELGKIKLGQKAEVSIDTYPDRKYEGKVTYISPEAEFTPKNVQTKDERTKLVFAVKITVDNKNFDLKPGMPADAKIYL